ncbi:hypothetical protein B0H11DRAFT_1920498 [Mycena galericulata]|nr:hypothetical protein B0H11DRAFT_1920498 [Mycena galericulata]
MPPITTRLSRRGVASTITFLARMGNRLRPRPAPAPRPALVEDREMSPLSEVWTRSHLYALGFQFLEWDMQPTPFIDQRRILSGAIIGPPTDEKTWEAVVSGANDALDACWKALDRSRLVNNTLSGGVGYGGPRPHPYTIKAQMDNMVQYAILRHTIEINALAAWQNTDDPDLFLPFDVPHERRPRDPSAFSILSYEFGASGSPSRLDQFDLLEGWRAITALGNYNCRYGGDLVLWDEKRVIKFPPGSTVLIPAARMRYSFTAVGDDETHYLVAQHTPAGLHRYVVNGYSHVERPQRQETAARTANRLTNLHSTLADYDEKFEEPDSD